MFALACTKCLHLNEIISCIKYFKTSRMQNDLLWSCANIEEQQLFSSHPWNHLGLEVSVQSIFEYDRQLTLCSKSTVDSINGLRLRSDQ